MIELIHGHPTDVSKDKVVKIALYKGDSKQRSFPWPRCNVESESKLATLLAIDPNLVVESIMPAHTNHFRFIEEEDTTSVANFVLSPTVLLACATRCKTHGGAFLTSPVQQLVPLAGGGWYATSKNLRVDASTNATSKGVYDWALLHFSDLPPMIMEVLKTNVVCLFPIFFLCFKHGFAPCSPHSTRNGWIFSWTPHEGFTLATQTYKHTYLTVHGTRRLYEDIRHLYAPPKPAITAQVEDARAAQVRLNASQPKCPSGMHLAIAACKCAK